LLGYDTMQPMATHSQIGYSGQVFVRPTHVRPLLVVWPSLRVIFTPSRIFKDVVPSDYLVVVF